MPVGFLQRFMLQMVFGIALTSIWFTTVAGAVCGWEFYQCATDNDPKGAYWESGWNPVSVCGPSFASGSTLKRRCLEACYTFSSCYPFNSGCVYEQIYQDTSSGQPCEGTCTEGSTLSSQSCYDGPSGTNGVGVCRGGTRTITSTCGVIDYSSACNGQVLPSTEEVCDGADNDCDGVIDNGYACVCGASKVCYEGPGGPDGTPISPCMKGTMTCTSGRWSACSGQILPSFFEVCDGVDNDCNGLIDDLPNPCDCSKDPCCGKAGQCCEDNASSGGK